MAIFYPHKPREVEETLTPDQMRLGHPTSPGPNDEYIPRHGRRDAADGMPGIPRLVRGRESHGPGMPGPTPSGPVQPDVIYAEGRFDAPGE